MAALQWRGALRQAQDKLRPRPTEWQPTAFTIKHQPTAPCGQFGIVLNCPNRPKRPIRPKYGHSVTWPLAVAFRPLRNVSWPPSEASQEADMSGQLVKWPRIGYCPTPSRLRHSSLWLRRLNRSVAAARQPLIRCRLDDCSPSNGCPAPPTPHNTPGRRRDSGGCGSAHAGAALPGRSRCRRR